MPGYRLNRGQPFNFGFVAGHGGPSYLVLIHSDDLDKLKELNHHVIWYYLRDAPPSASARYTDESGVLREPWRKHHLSKFPKLAHFYEGRGMRKIDTSKEDPNVPLMMWPEDGGNFWAKWKDKLTMYNFPRSWSHFSGNLRIRDRIVAYTNPRFPWIQVSTVSS